MRPLDDITVVEVDGWMAAPSCGAILADMGARVIKVEPPQGDPMRNTQRPPKLPDELKSFDYQFGVDNRGKESVVVDLTDDRGVEMVHALCRDADVFLCNLLVERQQRFRLDPESLLAENPKLVHATFTGYGTTGPEAWRPGFDVTAFFARSGLLDASREGPDGVIPMARPAQGDHTAGLALFGAIVSGLRLAERTGEGQVVEASLYGTAVWTQATDYAITAVDRKAVNPRERERQIQATRNRYRCGDGRWVVFNIPEESRWPGFCETIGAPDILDDERFVDLSSRFRNMQALVARVDAALAEKTRDEWAPLFDEAGFVWAPALGLHEVVDDPQAEAIGLFPTLTDDTIGEYRTVANPMVFQTADVLPRTGAPDLGADTRDALTAAGIDPDEIEALLAAGVIAQSDPAG